MDPLLLESPTLLNAQLSFLNTRVALIHIPLKTYPLFLQPILRLILHNDCRDEDGELFEPSKPWMFWHPFVNVSITPNECSIVCPRQQAERLFAPVIEGLDPSLRRGVSISTDDYSVIAIGGEGLEAGKRVLDLTSPLAMAGISIFFITSYYSDFILVPFGARSKVISALEDRGFVFEAGANGDAGHMANPASPLLHARPRSGSSASSIDLSSFSGTPPIGSVSELQIKTFKLLKSHGITAQVDESMELVTCAGIKDTTASSSAANYSGGKLQLGVTKCLTAMPTPNFVSLTLTDSESASLTLEKRLISLFHNEGEDLLLGKDGPEQVSLTLDLQKLPWESTGIVCGVADRLTEGMKGRVTDEVFNMSYLSTAKAGHVIVYMDELKDAMNALRGAELNGMGQH